MRKYLFLIVALVVVAWLLRTSLFTVDRTEFVYLTQFGRPVATFDGARARGRPALPHGPGRSSRCSASTAACSTSTCPGRNCSPTTPSGNTIDKTLTIDAYVCWRIADARTAWTASSAQSARRSGARTVLGQRISSELGAAIGKMELDDLISTDGRPARWRSTRSATSCGRSPRTTATGRCSETALTEYGIELVDVRLRRTNHPPAVREAIFDRIRSERDKKVGRLPQRGRAAGRRTSRAQPTARCAETLRPRPRPRSSALQRPGRRRGRPHPHPTPPAKDPQFYAFLKKLEDYQRILGDNKTMLLLSTHRELFDLLFQPPQARRLAEPVVEGPAKSGDKPKGDEP